MKFTRKRIYIFSAVGIGLVLLLWGFWPEAIPVSVQQARIAPLEVTVEEEGITQVIDRYTVSAPVSGYLLRLKYQVGDTVLQDQVLSTILPVPDLLSARQRQIAAAQLEAAEARMQQALQNQSIADEESKMADTDYTRLKNLYDSGIGSAQGLDNASLAARRAAGLKASAAFAVQVAQHEVEAARAALHAYQEPGNTGEVEIRSPVRGRLLKIYQQSEEAIQAGAPISDIGDPLSLEIKVDLLSTDAVRIEPGMRVRIKRWGIEHILEGVVRKVEPAGYTKISALGVEEQRVPVIVDFASEYKEWAMLGDGYRIVAEFLLWEADSVLQIPSSALFRMGDAWTVFVVDKGRARQRSVVPGKQSGLQTQILTGVEEGTTVITHPDERIEDGSRVRVQNF